MGKELEKVRRWRERMKAEGKQAVTLWLNRGAVERLNTLAHEAKITASEFIERAVTDTTAKVTDMVTVTQPKVTDTVTDTVAVIREIVREEVERALYQAAKRGVTVTQSKVTDTIAKVTDTVTDTVTVTPPKVTDTTRKAAALTAEELANEARALHQRGLSYEQIARQWDSEGIPTLRGGRQWQRGTVYNLVHPRSQRR
jgi:hypothetical protein